MHQSIRKHLWVPVILVLLVSACKKQDLIQEQPTENQQVRTFGAIPDDPKRLATVPLIVSQSFFVENYQAKMLKKPTSGGGKGNSGGSTSDATSPTVSITSPENGASVTGTISVNVSASDNVGVSSVSLSVDGNVIATSTTSPYSFSWNTSNFSSGSHTLTAKATDAAGNWSSYSISVSVSTTVISPPSTSGFSLVTPPVGNQGGEGSCVSFAIGYAARSIQQYYKTSTTSYSYGTNIFSPEFLYNQLKVGDCGSGSSILRTLDYIKLNGVCTWETMPYSSTNGCSLMPTSTQMAEAANYKIASYYQIYNNDHDAIKKLVSSNKPVMFGASVDQAFVDLKAPALWSSIGAVVGYHAMAIVGYDDSKNAYKVINSWGTSWGDNGFVWIDYNHFSQVSYSCFVMDL